MNSWKMLKKTYETTSIIVLQLMKLCPHEYDKSQLKNMLAI